MSNDYTPDIAWRQMYEDEFHRNAALALTEQRLRKELEQANAIIERAMGDLQLAVAGESVYTGEGWIAKDELVIMRGGDIVCSADRWPELAAWLERRNEVQNP